MTRRTLALIALTLMLLTACAGRSAGDSFASEDANSALGTPPPLAESAAVESASSAADGATPTPAPPTESASSDAAGATTPPATDSASSDADGATTPAPTTESASSDADGATPTPAPPTDSASSDAAGATTPAPLAESASSDADAATTPPTTESASSDAAGATTTPAPPPLATRVGSDYVLLLPREDTVPAGWAISPPPDFQTRAPGPDDTYRFACRDLPARSIGIATVGYRHLDGLPSVAVEYVIYPSAEDAAAALADMQAAAETCGDFTIGQGAGATAATFAPLEFEALGDASFAAALTTGGGATGDLLIHVVKVQQGHVVIGISHSAAAGEAPPDTALTRALAERAIENLRDGPPPPGPSA